MRLYHVIQMKMILKEKIGFKIRHGLVVFTYLKIEPKKSEKHISVS